MSFHYLQGQEVVCSDHISWDGKQFAPSKLKTILGGYCLPDKKMDCCHGSPSGMTSPLLTESPGGAELTSLRAGFLAKTSVAPEKAKESPGSARGCGVKWQESLAKYDLDTHSWKTHQCLFEEDLPWSSVTLPKWGMLVNGVLSERTMPVDLTSGTGFGYLPTPAACDGSKGPAKKIVKNGKQSSMRNLVTIAVRDPHGVIWPTPATRGYKGANSKPYSERGSGKKGEQLPNAVAHGGTLTRQTFPTPTNSMMTYVDMEQARFSGSDKNRPKYQDVKYPTPASGGRTGGVVGLAGGSGARKKLYVMMGEETGKKMGSGQLNPDWVEWMMNWPIGWTSIKPLSVEKFRAWEQLSRIGAAD